MADFLDFRTALLNAYLIARFAHVVLTATGRRPALSILLPGSAARATDPRLPIVAERTGMHGRAEILPHERLRARSEEHTSELQSLMRISYAVFCLHQKKKNTTY